MSDIGGALRDFLSQPFGVAGALAIMAAVTVINVRRLRERTDARFGVETVFNSLNLFGGTSLFVNAVLRDEIVWIVLETYFIAIAIKGLLMQSGWSTSRHFDVKTLRVPLTVAVVGITAALFVMQTMSPSIVQSTGQLRFFEATPAAITDEVLSDAGTRGELAGSDTCSE